jgi:hypothetical protein
MDGSGGEFSRDQFDPQRRNNINTAFPRANPAWGDASNAEEDMKGLAKS